MKKKNKVKKVYVGLAADILHEGHINILKIAKSYGEVTVGLLTDAAISSYKKLPHLNFKQREIVLKNIKYVKYVIPQKTLSYVDNLIKLKPNYVVHGDDWKNGIQKNVRKDVILTLKKWSGRLIEPKGILSLQKHHHRAEHWYITKGNPKITLNNNQFKKAPNDHIFIPVEAIHRIQNLGKKSVKILEAQIGSLLKESDIVRYKDIYGRAK